MCSDELPAAIAKQGFKGAQSMPRKINYEPETKTLRSYPVKEMQQLRGKQVWYRTQLLLQRECISSGVWLPMPLWLPPVGQQHTADHLHLMSRHIYPKPRSSVLAWSCTQPHTQHHLLSWQSEWTQTFAVLLPWHFLLPCLMPAALLCQ